MAEAPPPPLQIDATPIVPLFDRKTLYNDPVKKVKKFRCKKNKREDCEIDSSSLTDDTSTRATNWMAQSYCTSMHINFT
jgi:hypothetical protein